MVYKIKISTRTHCQFYNFLFIFHFLIFLLKLKSPCWKNSLKYWSLEVNFVISWFLFFFSSVFCHFLSDTMPDKKMLNKKTYVVGMSIEKLFDMWRNDAMTNFHATHSNVFFWSTKLRQARQCRDSCTYYIIFQNFVISSHIK